MFSFRIGSRGALAFAADARVAHLNRSTFRAFLWDQHKHGIGAAEIARRVDFPRRGVYAPFAAPAAAAMKLHGIARRLRGPREVGAALLLSPLVACGITAWMVGLVRSPRRRYPALPLPDPFLESRRG